MAGLMNDMYRDAMEEFGGQGTLTMGVAFLQVFLQETGFRGPWITFLLFLITTIFFAVQQARQRQNHAYSIKTQFTRLGVNCGAGFLALFLYLLLLFALGIEGGTPAELAAATGSTPAANWLINYMSSFMILSAQKFILNLVLLVPALKNYWTDRRHHRR